MIPSTRGPKDGPLINADYQDEETMNPEPDAV
jgi:hypothetical protein